MAFAHFSQCQHSLKRISLDLTELLSYFDVLFKNLVWLQPVGGLHVSRLALRCSCCKAAAIATNKCFNQTWFINYCDLPSPAMHPSTHLYWWLWHNYYTRWQKVTGQLLCSFCSPYDRMSDHLRLWRCLNIILTITGCFPYSFKPRTGERLQRNVQWIYIYILVGLT